MMRVAILETDGTYEGQSRLLKLAECRLRLDVAGLRYMSTRETLAAVAERLKDLPAELVFLGSSDFHHLALPLIERHARQGPLSVVVFDRHVDIFPAPRGFVSCGSWIREATRLPAVRRILVLGPTRGANAHPPKVTALTPQAWRYCFSRTPNLFQALLPTDNLYLSIDKDVFSGLPTSWGRGEVPLSLVFAFLHWLLPRRRLVGADVCGEVRPRGPWPTLAELKSIAASERLNLALCRLLRLHHLRTPLRLPVVARKTCDQRNKLEGKIRHDHRPPSIHDDLRRRRGDVRGHD